MNHNLPAILGISCLHYPIVLLWTREIHQRDAWLFKRNLKKVALTRCRYLAPSVLLCSGLTVLAERTYGNHLDRPGDVRTLRLADILGPAGHFYSFSRGRGKRELIAINLGLATAAGSENKHLSPRNRRSLLLF